MNESKRSVQYITVLETETSFYTHPSVITVYTDVTALLTPRRNLYFSPLVKIFSLSLTEPED